MHPALLYLPDDRLTRAELAAARLDGHLIEIGDAYVPADLVESAAMRAASLSPLLGPGLAAAGPSAAWIHGAGDAPPSPHHARRGGEKRPRSRQSARLQVHETPIPAADIERIGGTLVTTKVRTMFDLALLLDRDPSALVWLRALDAVDRDLVISALERLHRHPRTPGSRTARRALSALRGASERQDDVTR